MKLLVTIVDGKVPVVRPFVDDNGRNFTLIDTGYLDVLHEVIWSTFRWSATRKGYWWMQDGDPVHCTTETKKNLDEEVPRQSNQSRHRQCLAGPLPDLNPPQLLLFGSTAEESLRSEAIYYCRNNQCRAAVRI